MILGVVSDVVWQALIGAAVTVVLAWMSHRTKTGVVAVVEKTAEKTEQQLAEIAHVGELNHQLANSAMLEQKRMLAVTSRAKADVTHDAVDLAAAQLAEEQYRAHAAKQAAMEHEKLGRK